MKFCDKLSKLRKENNLSQEQLAESLGVSRQAVSKWESSSSYPDMEKMIAMCKILNCTLEDLLDDGTIKSTTSNKFNFNSYVNDFLKFITKIYNMFSVMSFKEKVKCLIEIVIIGFILFILSSVIFSLLNTFIFNLFTYIPKVGNYIYFIFEKIFTILLLVISFIILVHIFKIRYLDYYITVEDQSAKEKSIEKPIETNNERKEKIIIRDPKHSNFSLLNLLTNIIAFIIKLALLFILFLFSLAFIFLIGTLAIGIYHIKYGIIFLTGTISVLGLLLLCYIFIEAIYNFIVSKKQKFKRLFILFLTGLSLFGIGLGFSFCTYLSFEKEEKDPKEFLKVTTKTLDFADNMVFDNDNITYNIDDSVKNVRLQSKYSDIVCDEMGGTDFNAFYIYKLYDNNKIMKLFYIDLKDKKRRNYNKFHEDPVVITVSKKHYEKLIENYSKYIDE